MGKGINERGRWNKIMNEVITKEKIQIENMIYEIRGKQVMLDLDLAKLYQVETKRINEAVKNNPEKFPDRFAWRLTDDELNYLWSKFSTAKTSNMSRTNPRVFTEQGIAMLSTILKSKVATNVSIRIMDAFVEMKKYISTNLIEQKYINQQVIKNTEDIKLLQKSLNKMNKTKDYDGIFFKGQVYDSYSLLMKILNKAKKKITIIDNYIDKNLLDILREINKDILIITNKYNNQDYTKYQSQYKISGIIYREFMSVLSCCLVLPPLLPISKETTIPLILPLPTSKIIN